MSSRGRFFRRLLRALQVVVTLALMGLLLQSVSWDNAVRMWRHVHLGFLAVSAVLLIITMACGAFTLLVLFELKGRLTWWYRFTVDYGYVQAICQLTPAQAGEVVLPYVAGRGRFAPGEIAATLVIQRIVALVIVVTVAVIGAGRWVETAMLWGAAGFILLGCFVIVVMIWHPKVRSRLNEVVGRRFGPVLYGFHDTWSRVFRERRGRLLLHGVLMLGRFLIGVAASYAVLMAFDVVVSFWDLAALTALASLAALVPISINGLGVTEGIFVAGLAGFGIASEPVLAACLTGRALGLLILLVWSASYWFLQRREGQAA